MSKKENSKEEFNFEEKVQRLEEIVNKMESPDLKLEESIALFEEGVALSKDCQGLIDKAEKKVQILLNDKLENFEREEA